MPDPIVPADPRMRRGVAIAVAVVIAVGLVLFAELQSELDRIASLAQRDPEAATARGIRLVTILALVAGLSLLGVGGWFWQLARRIRRTDQYPPPGMRLLRDTPLLAGTRAWTVATKAKVIAVLTWLLGLAIAWYLWQLAVGRLRGG